MPEKSERAIGVVLCLGAVISVLAFGGVDTVTFAPAEIAVALLSAVVFWRDGWPKFSWPVWAVISVLLAIPVLQLIPLPQGVIAAAAPARISHTD